MKAYVKHRCWEHRVNDTIDITLFYFILASPAHVGSFLNISVQWLWNFEQSHFSEIDRIILTTKLPMVFKWAILKRKKSIDVCLSKYRPISLQTMRLLLYEATCLVRCGGKTLSTLQWGHNGHDGVSNHQDHDCLLSRVFRHSSTKMQSSASLSFVWGIHRWPGNSPHKGRVKRKMFPFDDIIMITLCWDWVFITKRSEA